MIGPKVRNTLLGLLSVACLALTGAVAYTLVFSPKSVEAPIIGHFDLTDPAGTRVTEATYEGKYLLIYFGYTYCPDVCPTELAKLAAALDRLTETEPDKAGKVVPIFISVDPERDTPEVLREYGPLFHPRLVTLSGSADQLKEAASSYRVFYAKVIPEGGSVTPDDYLMDHSSQIYLMGTDARYLTHFPSGTSPEIIAKTLSERVS